MKEYLDNLTHAAKPVTYSKARELKHLETDAEKIIWGILRNRSMMGKKFRRQHPLDIFIADFYCHEKRLIIEIDGGIHETTDQKEYDEGRTYELLEKGFKVIRITNDEVFNSLDVVVERIKNELS